MATNTTAHLSLVRTVSEVQGSEAATLARIAFSAAWAKARQDYPCDGGHAGCHGIAAGSVYFSARLASGTVRFCRPCADRPALVTMAPADPFDFDGAA